MKKKTKKQLERERMETESWVTAKWRPMMAWMYALVCVCDFVIFPVLWSIIQSIDLQGSVVTPWTPLTLQGAGMFHMAMGAIIGVSAFGRTQEKLAGALNISPTTGNVASSKPPAEEFPPK